eukprot:TRINITY_DN72010_c0_g1_i1.p3 TRINITY_DN72010_c0_g1~~TRINITY_DN72010_c0_g1_i1.p3  ORF type:complete len:109 (-),score=10.90 TRINITY_DN72010_c0_g1_i1:423-749(-)
MDSQSNGSLMRISPLAVYVSKILDNTVLEKVVRAEVELTHSNKVVQDAAVAYCIAIRELISGTRDCKKAYLEAKLWAISYGHKELQAWFKEIDDGVLVCTYNNDINLG